MLCYEEKNCAPQQDNTDRTQKLNLKILAQKGIKWEKLNSQRKNNLK